MNSSLSSDEYRVLFSKKNVFLRHSPKIGQKISEYTVEQLFQMPSFSRTSKNSHLARQFTEFTTGERFERRYCSLCHICVIIIIICSNMCPIRE